MRKIFLIAAFGFLISSGAWAQDNSGTALPSNPQRLIHEQDLNRLKPKLEEYHQGKLDTHDGYVIMFRMLLDYGELKEGDTPEAKALQQEFNLFKKAHPDVQRSVSWVVHSGTMSIIENDFYTSDEKAQRAAQDKKEQELKGKAKSFVPKDIHMVGAGLYGANDLAIAVYQYRLEFYHLPKGMSWREMKIYQGAMEVPPTKFVNIIRPDKIMTFKHPFSFRPLHPATFNHPFWVCTNLLAGYMPRGSDEEEILKGGPIPWVNATGRYEDFCGAISLDGKIIYRLSIKQELPEKLLSLRMVSKDGKKALLFLGEGMEDQTGEGMEVGKLRKALVWEYPDKISEFNPNDQTRLRTLLLEMRHKNHRKK